MENTTKSEAVIFQEAFIATTVFCFIATLVITVGNFGLIYALYKNLENNYSNPSLLLFMNLVVSDFLTGAFVGSLTTADAFIDIFGKNSVVLDICVFLFGGLLLFVNNLTITAMSVDRLIAVVKPLLYRSIITTKRIKVLIAIIWILPLLISLLPPIFRVPQWLLLLIYSHSHATIPLVCLTIVYGLIFRSLKKQRRDFLNPKNNELGVKTQSWENEKRKRVERNHSLTVTIAMVMVLFCVSSFPFVIGVHVLTYIQHCDHCLSELSMRVVSSVVYLSARCILINSALDPFLLTWRMLKIRRAVRKTYAQRFRIFSKSVALPQLRENGTSKALKASDKPHLQEQLSSEEIASDGTRKRKI